MTIKKLTSKLYQSTDWGYYVSFLSDQIAEILKKTNEIKHIATSLQGYSDALDVGLQARSADVWKDLPKNEYIYFSPEGDFCFYAPTEMPEQDTDIVNSGTIKEVNNDVPQLKYGQGSIQRIERKNKGGGVYTYWQGRYMCAGKQKTVTAKTAEQCRKKLAEARKNVPILERQSSKDVGSLSKWFEDWFTKYRKPKLKISTIKTYEHAIRVLQNSSIGSIALRDLRSEPLQDFLISMPHANTRKKFFDMINACLRKAVALEYIRKNPMELVEIPANKSSCRRAYTFAEQNALLSEFSEKYANVFRFLCCTGLRVGEFVALTNANIDRKRHLIWITASIPANEKDRTTPKTDSSVRAVPYLDDLFDGIDLGTYTYYGIKKAFAKVLKKLQIKGAFIHSSRHTFSSLCYFYGIDDKTIQSWLGHKTVAMTMDTYTHILDEGSSPIGEYIMRLRNAYARPRA